MKLFAVECQYYIEDYYRAYSIRGIYDTREGAEAQIDAELQKFRRKNLESAMSADVEKEIIPCYPELQTINDKITALRETYPVFDQNRKGDKEYVKEHTAKKHAVKSLINSYDQRHNYLMRMIWSEVSAEVEKRMKDIDRVERFYNEIDLDTYYGRFDAMRVKEIELNKPISASIEDQQY